MSWAEELPSLCRSLAVLRLTKACLLLNASAPPANCKNLSKASSLPDLYVQSNTLLGTPGGKTSLMAFRSGVVTI